MEEIRRVDVLELLATFEVVCDWYVDSEMGADSNDGRAISTPFKTIAKLMTKNISVGTQIGLACGSHWHEQLSVPANNVRISAYGTGEKPILDSSDVIPINLWSKTGGKTYVYQATVTVIAGWTSVWENSIRLVRVVDLATCDSTAGSYYCVDVVGSMILYVHASDGSHPRTNGKTYEATLARACGIWASGHSGTLVNGVHCKRNRSDSGSFVMYKNTTLLNCLASEGTKHNVYVGEGSYLFNVEARDAYYQGGALTLFVYNDDVASGGNVTFINCKVTNTGAYVANAEGFYGHINVSGSYGVITYKGCTVDKYEYGLDGCSAISMVIDGCTVSGCMRALFLYINTVITNTKLIDGAANYNAVIIAADGINVSMDNVYFNAPTSLATYYINPNGKSYNLTITNCNFNVPGNTILVCLVGTNDVLVANGNTFGNASFTNGAPFMNAGASATITSDYNNFRQEVCTFNFRGTYYFNVTDYKAGTGQDSHSTVG
jgi:hypothetical protein